MTTKLEKALHRYLTKKERHWLHRSIVATVILSVLMIFCAIDFFCHQHPFANHTIAENIAIAFFCLIAFAGLPTVGCTEIFQAYKSCTETHPEYEFYLRFTRFNAKELQSYVEDLKLRHNQQDSNTQTTPTRFEPSIEVLQALLDAYFKN